MSLLGLPTRPRLRLNPRELLETSQKVRLEIKHSSAPTIETNRDTLKHLQPMQFPEEMRILASVFERASFRAGAEILGCTPSAMRAAGAVDDC
jgi:hypothetical protein